MSTVATDVKDMSMAELVENYNKVTGKTLSKFKNRDEGVRRLKAALAGEPEKAAKAPKAVKEKKAKAPKEPKGPNARSLVNLEAGKEQTQPKDGTKRRQIFDLINNRTGLTLEEITKSMKWSNANTREALRILNATNGYGIETLENGNVRIVK